MDYFSRTSSPLLTSRRSTLGKYGLPGVGPEARDRDVRPATDREHDGKTREDEGVDGVKRGNRAARSGIVEERQDVLDDHVNEECGGEAEQRTRRSPDQRRDQDQYGNKRHEIADEEMPTPGVCHHHDPLARGRIVRRVSPFHGSVPGAMELNANEDDKESDEGSPYRSESACHTKPSSVVRG
jgi:hypothetical protein